MNYINEIEIQREIIICKGKMKRSKKLEVMLITLAERVVKMKTFKTPEIKEDVFQNCIYELLMNWYKCDIRRANNGRGKYELVFPYLTECAKRAMSAGLNEITGRKYWNDDLGIKLISISNMHSI